MTFLKRVGQILMKAVEVWAGFSQTVQREFPGVAGVVQVVTKDLTQVAQIVTEVEAIGQIGGLAGPDKLKAAAPLVAQVIMQSALMDGKTVADPALFAKACEEIAGGMADLLNSLSVQGIVTTPVATPPAA